jgi:hypothetical protein
MNLIRDNLEDIDDEGVYEFWSSEMGDDCFAQWEVVKKTAKRLYVVGPYAEKIVHVIDRQKFETEGRFYHKPRQRGFDSGKRVRENLLRRREQREACRRVAEEHERTMEAWFAHLDRQEAEKQDNAKIDWQKEGF